jgi:outer membrane protein assembly factor BamE (lipoprotein component of BamABCDE complex)
MTQLGKILVLACALVAGCAAPAGVKPWWTLHEPNFRSLAAGTSQQDVRQALGEPMLKTRFPNLGEEVWDYRYAHGTFTYIGELHFDTQGRLKYYTGYPDPSIYSTVD